MTNVGEDAGFRADANDSSSANTTAGDDGIPWSGGIGDGLGGVLEFDFMPEELSESVRTLFCVLYAVVAVLGLGGNSLTLIVVVVNREMRTVTNVFLVSLAVSDALIAGVNMPLHVRLFVEHNEWTLGQLACKFAAYSQGVVIVASILTLISLAVDRYYAICHPLRARHIHTTSRALVVVAIIWFSSLVLVSPQLVVQRLEPMLVLQTADQQIPIRVAQVCVEYIADRRLAIAYTSFFYVVVYLLPVMTMLVAYGRIVVTLWRRRPIGDSPQTTRDSHRRLKEKRRIVCMLALLVLLFAVCWFPFFSVQLYLLVDDHTHRQHHARIVVSVLQLVGYSNCCVNPVIYYFINESFQRNLLRTLRCRCLATTPGYPGMHGGVQGLMVAVSRGRADRARRGSDDGVVETSEMQAVNGGRSTAFTTAAQLHSTFV